MSVSRAGSEKGARAFFRAGSGPAAALLAASLAAALAASLAAALTLAGCARRAPEAPVVVYPYSADSARTFYASESGLAEEPPRGEAGAKPGLAGGTPAPEGMPATRAPNVSVLSSDGRSIVAVVNGWGIARIEPDPGARAGGDAKGDPAYRIEGKALPSIFAGLTAAGAWPVAGGFLVQLFRDPFTEASSPSSHLDPPYPLPKARLAFLGSKGGEATAFDPFAADGDSGFELFALLPSRGRWFAELRKDGPSRVEMKFLALGDAPAVAGPEAKPVEIGRTDFEAALMPNSLASLGGAEGASLRAALRALGEGPWLVRLRSSGGGDAWYLSAGKAEEASPVYAWSDSAGTVALRSDGWLASSKTGIPTKLASLGEPEPGASFTALAATGELVAAAWETGEFPDIEEAGLVVAPLPR